MSDTVAGSSIPLTYNNQADYVLAIPSYVDSALMDIVTRAKHIPEVTPLESLECDRIGTYNVYTMPSDFQSMMHGGLVAMQNDGYGQDILYRYRNYRIVGGKLYVPTNAPHGMIMEYWRYPTSVGESPSDYTTVDGTPDMHSAIPYYVAAQLVMYDDAFRYQALRNEYETKIALLHDPVFVEQEPINDVYNFFGGGF